MDFMSVIECYLFLSTCQFCVCYGSWLMLCIWKGKRGGQGRSTDVRPPPSGHRRKPLETGIFMPHVAGDGKPRSEHAQTAQAHPQNGPAPLARRMGADPRPDYGFRRRPYRNRPALDAPGVCAPLRPPPCLSIRCCAKVQFRSHAAGPCRFPRIPAPVPPSPVTPRSDAFRASSKRSI